MLGPPQSFTLGKVRSDFDRGAANISQRICAEASLCSEVQKGHGTALLEYRSIVARVVGKMGRLCCRLSA